MRKEFTKEEVEILKANKNVFKCTSRRITFTEKFKGAAVKKYSEGLTSVGIFREAGLDINVIGRKTPKECLRNWRKQLKTKGDLKDNRGKHGKSGRKPKEKIPKDEREKIKYMEAKIAYLEKENEVLAKMRAKRKEEE